MIDNKIVAVTLVIVTKHLGLSVPFDLCLYICQKLVCNRVNKGRSSFARKRRAKQIGRCHRCYRVYPGFYYTTRCDNKTCVPGISYPIWVEEYIKYGK